jgi:hypothetical protein
LMAKGGLPAQKGRKRREVEVAASDEPTQQED